MGANVNDTPVPPTNITRVDIPQIFMNFLLTPMSAAISSILILFRRGSSHLAVTWTFDYRSDPRLTIVSTMKLLHHLLISHPLIFFLNSAFLPTMVLTTRTGMSLEKTWGDPSIDLLFRQCRFLVTEKNPVWRTILGAPWVLYQRRVLPVIDTYAYTCCAVHVWYLNTPLHLTGEPLWEGDWGIFMNTYHDIRQDQKYIFSDQRY